MTDERRSVIRNELAWHEEESPRRYRLDALLYDPPAFDAVVASALDFLGGKPGERVLDMGGGEGKETLELAARGMRPISLDLSHRQLSRARELIRAQDPAAPVYFIQANAEELPFADASFRVVYGKAILHHLDLDLAAAEITRVMQADGRATFAEPLADHPLIGLGRRLTPRLRTRDEQPIRADAMERFAGRFNQPQCEVYFLTMPLASLLRLLPGGERAYRWAHARLSRLDARLFARFPGLRKYAWYGVVKVKKETSRQGNK